MKIELEGYITFTKADDPVYSDSYVYHISKLSFEIPKNMQPYLRKYKLEQV